MELALPKQPSNKLPRRPRRSIKTFGVIQSWHSNMDHRGPSGEIFLKILKIPRVISRLKGKSWKNDFRILRSAKPKAIVTWNNRSLLQQPDLSRRAMSRVCSQNAKIAPRSKQCPWVSKQISLQSGPEFKHFRSRVWKVTIRHVNQVKQQTAKQYALISI